jgi:hypothetical protein
MVHIFKYSKHQLTNNEGVPPIVLGHITDSYARHLKMTTFKNVLVFTMTANICGGVLRHLKPRLKGQ